MRGQNQNQPRLNHRYPFKIGKSLRPSSRATRQFLALKFNQIPEKAALSKPGTLTPSPENCSLSLHTQDSLSAVNFTGTRRTAPDSNWADYVLVFANNKVYLERTTDYFYGLRPVDIKTHHPPPVLPDNPPDEDDPMRDPDSWMPHQANSPPTNTGLSPVTPESVSDGQLNGSNRELIPPAQGRVAGKSTPPLTSNGPPKRKLVSGSDVTASTARTEAGVAAKSIAGKSVAGKGLSGNASRQSRKRDDDDDDGSDASSSEDDDSEDSDSDSDSDSENEYTDGSSSDEE